MITDPINHLACTPEGCVAFAHPESHEQVREMESCPAKELKLYDIPRDSKIKLPIGGEGRETKDEMCDFKHVDGMYSLILTEEGHAVHLGASTSVKKVGDHYELINP